MKTYKHLRASNRKCSAANSGAVERRNRRQSKNVIHHVMIKALSRIEVYSLTRRTDARMGH